MVALIINPYTLIATASLVVEIVVLALVLYGYFLKRRQNFRRHGITMTSAVVLHTITIFVIMIPSFVLALVPEFIVPKPLELISIIALIHGITGILAISLGVWLVTSWHFRKDLSTCFKKKLFMRVTITVWITSLVLGIFIYLFFYGASLIGM